MLDPQIAKTIDDLEKELTTLATQAEQAVKNGVLACDEVRAKTIAEQIAQWQETA